MVSFVSRASRAKSAVGDGHDGRVPIRATWLKDSAPSVNRKSAVARDAIRIWTDLMVLEVGVGPGGDR